MTKEQVNALLERGELKQSEMDELLNLFFADANGDCALVWEFLNYCLLLIKQYGSITYFHVHQCCYSYIANIENNHPELKKNLVNLYSREAEYFIMLDESKETLYYARQILSLGDSAPLTSKVSAYLMILNILVGAKLFDRLPPYMEELKLLVHDDRVIKAYQSVLLLSLMDCNVFLRNHAEYSDYADQVRAERSLMTDEDFIRESFDIHLIAAAFAFPEEYSLKTDEELCADFKQVANLLEASRGVMDIYEPLFIPMFDLVHDKMPRNDFVNIVKRIIVSCPAQGDKIAFYEYLMSVCKITEEHYPEVFADYFNLLRKANERRAEGEKQSVEISMFEDELRCQYQEAANTDKLTGLKSKYAYSNSIAELNLSEDTVLLVVDMNRLKYVNDNYGHAEGDRALITAADKLKRAFSAYGDVYRCGGDEFCIIANANEEQIKEAIASLDDGEELLPGYRVELSVGYAMSSDYPGESPEFLIRIADRNMYLAKDAYYTRTGLTRWS